MSEAKASSDSIRATTASDRARSAEPDWVDEALADFDDLMREVGADLVEDGETSITTIGPKPGSS